MKPWSDYDKTISYRSFPTLPKGGYVLMIMDARMETAINGNRYLAVSCDIAEGEYKDFYMNRWNTDSREDRKWGCVGQVWEPLDDGSERDGWTKKAFKTFTESVEDSNAGYHWDWDETKLKGKMVGGLFHINQYIGNDGNVHSNTRLKSWDSVQNIRDGKFTLPNDKLIESPAATTTSYNDGFMDVTDDPNGLPFK